MPDEWVIRWKYEIAKTESAPDIWRLRKGGFLVRARVQVDGVRKPKVRALPEAKLHEAKAYQAKLLGELRDSRLATKGSRTLFASYAQALFERKVQAGDLSSPKTQERWRGTLVHLIEGRCGEGKTARKLGAHYLDEIDIPTLELWKSGVAKRVRAGEFAPTTANGWISILRIVMKRASKEYRLPNVAEDLDYFGLKTHRTYTKERPNALTQEWALKFLAAMREKFPQHYAMTLLGFVTGLRPSTLRPLRRKGPHADLDWRTGMLAVRRSNPIGQEIVDATKTARDQDLALPPNVVEALHEHVAVLESPPLSRWRKPPQWWGRGMPKSDLLFPARTGGYRSRSCLDKPFALVGAAIGLPFPLTPRGMRRTNKDLARAAGVSREASKAISGHATDEMHALYSTVGVDEMRVELGKIAAILHLGGPRKVGEAMGETTRKERR